MCNCMYMQVWDVLTLKEIHRIPGISQSWVRALAYDRRKVTTCTCMYIVVAFSADACINLFSMLQSTCI